MQSVYSQIVCKIITNNHFLLKGKKIALVSNTAWNHWNYRRALIHLLIEHNAEVILIAPDDDSTKQLKTEFPQVSFVPLRQLSRKSLSLLSNFRTFWELYSVLKNLRPDAILCYTIKPNIFGNVSAGWLRIPSIGIVEGLGYAGTAPLLIRWVIFRLYKYASKKVFRLIFQNHHDRAEFIKSNAVDPKKTMVITGNGVDTTFFQPSPPPLNSSPIFIFVGRLLSEKGIREFVSAGKMVKKVLPNARFQVLGSPDAGNPASILPVELEEWIVKGEVEYLGQTDDVRPYICNADVMTLPSYYREGLPCSLLEGMAMGKPIITTDSVGCRDTVEHGKNGYIIPIADIKALKDAMLQFAALPVEKQISMGTYSRKKVLREFCKEVILPHYLEQIQMCLQNDTFAGEETGGGI